MRAKRSDTKYNGVTHDPTRKLPYRAWIKHDEKLIRLGDYAVEIHAALVADYARWLVWGHPSKWYHAGRRRMSKPPNFGPIQELPFDRQAIIRLLLDYRAVDPVTLTNNRTAYEDLAAELAEQHPS